MGKKQQPTNRSRTPLTKEFLEYISKNWAPKASIGLQRHPVADFALIRRAKLAAQFSGKVIVIESGSMVPRSNDDEYRFRPLTAFAHLTGWGSETEPDSILVIDARKKTLKTHLYLRPTAGYETEEFFANPAIGEFWVGSRPTLDDVSSLLGIPTRDIKDFAKDSKKWDKTLTLKNAKLSEAVSVLRFVKDDYEITEMRKAVNATILGFADVARALPIATRKPRGERVVETAFYSRARLEGYDLGYSTIAASGANACTLHWNRNDGEVLDGDLILVDAGVEMDSLYTADVTRTIPVNGKFTELQKKVYDAVLEAADAAFAIAKPGIKFKDIHNAAIEVIAKKTAELGLLPVSAEESLKPENQFHRRFMVHGTSHHLGMDVHDCALARREMYQDGILEEGMIFTIEPGLYFHKDDLMVPEELRGMGIRIEDDVLVTKDGVENLSGALPRTTSGIEAWFQEQLLGSAG